MNHPHRKAPEDATLAEASRPLLALPCELDGINIDDRGDFYLPIKDADGQLIGEIAMPDGSDSDEAHQRGWARARALLRAINKGQF
jgi:hypothetical protein